MLKTNRFAYKLVLQENIYDTVKDLETFDDCGIIAFKDFHYFSYHTIRYSSLFSQEGQKEPIFFIAYEDEKIVGVLKLGHYVRDTYDFWSVNYIDVHRKHRQQGIATFLYEKLNEWSKGKEIVILGTNLSKDGEKAKIHDLRKRLLTNVPTFDTEEEYYYELRKQHSNKNLEKTCMS